MNEYVQWTGYANKYDSALGIASIAAAAVFWWCPPECAALVAVGLVEFNYASNASAGQSWVENYVANWNGILGTTTSDAFIPFSDQSMDLQHLGGQAMLVSTTKTQYTWNTHLSHQYEVNADLEFSQTHPGRDNLWGDSTALTQWAGTQKSAALDRGIGPGGILDTILQCRYVKQTAYYNNQNTNKGFYLTDGTDTP